MTNEEIIWRESCALMQQGILKPGSYEEMDGRYFPMPEEIHTFAGWKAKGYSVKKGEHAIAAFPIWVYQGQRRTDAEEDDENEPTQGRCYLKKSFWFKREQVEWRCP